MSVNGPPPGAWWGREHVGVEAGVGGGEVFGSHGGPVNFDERPQHPAAPVASLDGLEGWGLSVCGTCHADEVARMEAAAEGVRLQAATSPEPEPEHDREPGKPRRGLFRCRG